MAPRARQTPIFRTAKDRRYSAIPRFFACYRRIRLRPSSRKEQGLGRPQTHENQLIHWILVLEFAGLRERSICLRLNRNFLKLTDNHQVKHLSGDIIWSATVDSLSTLHTQYSIATSFSKHAQIRLSWIRHLQEDLDFDAYTFDDVYRLDYPKIPRFNQLECEWWHVLFVHLAHLRGYSFLNRSHLHCLHHIDILSNNHLLPPIMTELCLKVSYYTDVPHCFLKLENFVSLEKLAIDFAMTNVSSADLDTLLTVLQNTSTPLKSLKLVAPPILHRDPIQYWQYLDVAKLPPTLEHLSLSNIDFKVDSQLFIDPYAKLASHLTGLRSLHIDGAFPFFSSDTGYDVRGGYTPEFLSKFPLLEECCFANVVFRCPLASSHYGYCHIHQLALSIPQFPHLKILDLSQMTHGWHFSLDSWGQKNPSLLFPSLFPLEQLYLPLSRHPCDVTHIRRWLKSLEIPYTITKRSDCLLISRF